MFQHMGVTQDHAQGKKFGLKSFLRLFTNRTWVLGLVFTFVGIACGTVALSLAAVMVVQPVGAISLVISVLLAQRTRRLRLQKRIIAAVATSTLGVAGFVVLSALNADSRAQTGTEAAPLVWVTAALLVVFLVIKLALRRAVQLVYVLGAGMLFATVATNTHIVTVQYLTYGWKEVTWLNVACIVVASLVGSIFVQSAYASGPPELVIAGLTVIDPIVAVVLGAVILGEAADTPIWLISIMTLVGLIACAGVIVLSRYHPDVLKSQSIT